ncbi:FecCD family ABC transporter permease [Alteribacillus bidgolensis]|uniref:Iron complex transport system permease protein n=1 Tax=Alteribacillus bidgolensis TaxID=930129 RepID=A0A1G8BZM8_9BACI|nr:iron ABC transporter permease [Alteribacillus bidgolensis]SDH38666.1 iron complex transport system permease protein [Alteribacillus bidgolensis]
MNSQTSKAILCYLIGAVFLFVCISIGISAGSLSIPFLTSAEVLWRSLWNLDMPVTINETHATIIWNIRLPRVLLAALVGSSLALAGAAFQGLLKNPLADPYTLGVSSGAALGAVFVLFLGLSIPLLGSFTLPVVSILTGFLTLFFLLGFVRFIEKSLTTETIILAGIIVSSFLGSLISLLIALTEDELRQIISWLMGSVAMRGWDYIWLNVPFFVLGAGLLFANRKELNALVFGEETAKTLGVDTDKRRMTILAGASLLTGAAVSVSGTIGFVGLVIPHLVRLLFGPDHRLLLPMSIFTGGGFLVLTDLAARTIISPKELPIGVITAIIGAPIFGILLFQQRLKRMK